ncbi:hypothetical protein NDU88_003988 [Pleurodeles waltl]|uniref:Uncharacterized protein n=1 Tax=Pleurodeles waltl TaxID=8319 RepID=A0AAV7VHG5_PLEWA|nr:hypothetical protein NDU88_003988 [Pleurodeles waltl]
MENRGKAAGSAWVRRPPAHFGENAESTAKASGMTTEAVRRTYGELELDKNLEELFLKLQELLTRQHKVGGDRSNWSPPTQSLAKQRRQATSERESTERIKTEKAPPECAGQIAFVARMAPLAST